MSSDVYRASDRPAAFEAGSEERTPRKERVGVAHSEAMEQKSPASPGRSCCLFNWFARREGDGTDTEGDGDEDLAGDQHR